MFDSLKLLPVPIKKKSRLSLKCTLNKVETIKNNQNLNPVSNAMVNYDSGDSLDDFKPPIKVDTYEKTGKPKRKRKIVRPYRYSGDTQCTQDIIVSAWKKAKANDTEYLSENEFQIFKEIRQKKKLQDCNKARNIKPNIKPKDLVIHHTSLLGTKASAGASSSLSVGQEKPVIKPTQLDCLLPSKGFSIRNAKSLRKGYENMKIQDVTIPDSDPSDDEVIESSQKPAPETRKKLQIVCQRENDVLNNIEMNSVVFESCETSKNKMPTVEPKLNEKQLDSSFEIKPFCSGTEKEIGTHCKMYRDSEPSEVMTSLDQLLLLQNNIVQNDELEQESKIVLETKSSPSLQEDTKAYDNFQNPIEKVSDKWNTPTNWIPQLPTIVQASQSGWHVFHSACKNVIEDRHLLARKIEDSSHRSKKLRYTYVRKLWWIKKSRKRKPVLTMTRFKSSRIVKSRSK